MEGMPTPSNVRFIGRRTDRLAAILAAVGSTSALGVGDLARRLGVSEATIRRDLAVLEDQSLLRRTHGGATSQDLAGELPVRYRDGHEREAKRRIAAACAETIPLKPQAIAMGGGTTTTEVARQLADRSGLTIVTNSLNVAMELTMRPRLRIILTGGQIRSESYEMVGAWTERFLEALNFGITVMGVDGISATGGLTTHDPVEARSNAKMVERAQRTIVVADRTKIGVVTMAKIADLSQVHLLITQTEAPPEPIAAIRARGLTVVQV